MRKEKSKGDKKGEREHMMIINKYGENKEREEKGR